MVRVSIRTRGALQIQDRSPQSRPVASRNQSQTHSDATGLSCGDRSWICNAPKMGGELRPILLLPASNLHSSPRSGSLSGTQVPDDKSLV